ncbi:oxygenase MpaB family protein [Frigoribacterium sp. CFBP9030]|uniref:oxygenase MpaB family protein n=1 Tax=Frigoribacterium sp. CFBP9030 TaxID=3096537 RepID=UPI002A6AC0FB|nr:oxygenase MpaB family protein [Frigoribacterium sp. CFBP9030]MDY0892825.1 oxygenase MpaB family protein [Frigoribacterium sp. CFBP9030]
MRLPWTLRGSDVRTIGDMAGESVLLAGGGRAILLQLADPAVGHGVADHSDFVDRPLSRLHGTMTYLYAVVFGSPAERAHVRREVGRAHRPVHADGSQGVRYDAFDPASQLWVAATLYDSAMTIFEQVHGPLTPEVADSVYQEYAVVGTALQMPRELWPTDREAFARYWAGAVDALVVDDVTRGVARQLLHPVNVPWWLRVLMPVARCLTLGSLPESVRLRFDLPWSARSARWYARVMGVAAVVVPHLPPRLRHVLRDGYLRRMRAAMASAPPRG